MVKSLFTAAGITKTVIIMFLLSCGNNASKNAQESKASADTTTKSTIMDTSKKAPKLITGFLHTLYIDATTFKNSKKRILFRFFSETSGGLTLHGWTNDGDTNPDDPDIKLMLGHESTIPFGDDTYFGNLVLKRDEHIAINTQITTGHFKFVVFIPHDPANGNANYPDMPKGQIAYDIELTNDDPSKATVAFTSTTTTKSLNPSPPRNPK